MEETTQGRPRQKRRKLTKLEIFKEVYLPYIIAAVTVITVVTLAAGGIVRAVTIRKAEKAQAKAASEAAASLAAEQMEEADGLIRQAEALGSTYDYDGAIAILDTFTGEGDAAASVLAKRQTYVQAKSSAVAWNEPDKIPNLSFQLLIADPARAFSDVGNGDSYNRDFVTTDEFSKILQQLYENGYVLVGIHDIVETTVGDDGSTTFTPGTVYLPPEKKPLVLTQCAVNYFTYMVDGDGDGMPDAQGDGFASRLMADDDGNILNEMVDSQGNLVTGAFDLVPILEAFLAQHPDFSYRGARAVLAVTGYDGVFGYRTDLNTKEKYAGSEEYPDYYNEQMSGAKKLVGALRNKGYEVACYSYDYLNYGSETYSRISEDLDDWRQEVSPVLGDVGILVYTSSGDIAEFKSDAYSGDTYHLLRDAGFRYFVGTDNTRTSWADVNGDYFRQTRRLVSGSAMTYHPEYFADLFDASAVLNSQRGTVPQD